MLISSRLRIRPDRFALTAALFAVGLTFAWAQYAPPKPAEKESAKEPAKAATAKAAVSVSKAYPLDIDIVSGKKLGPNAVVKTIDGREVRFVDEKNAKEFESDKVKWSKKLDEAIIAAQKPDYPLDTCVVDGKKLGGEGKAVEYVQGNRLVQFCSDACAKEFRADPAKYLSQLDQAIVEKQQKTYPLTTCVVSGEGLTEMGKPVNYIYAGQLVEFCCPSCKKDFDKEPAKYTAKIAEARKSGKAPMGDTKGKSDKPAQEGQKPATQTGHEGHTM